MTDANTPPQDLPLVTFALFAYNQEKFIREAVDGAFSQTYEPLEIILSDDCSSDRTFEIMQEMAAEYDGPHRVRVRQNEVNLGLVDHVCAVAEVLRGEFVVFAAGDDVSKPERTASLARVWNGQHGAVFSVCDLIDQEGRLLHQNWASEADARKRLPWLKEFSTPLFVYGATSSYDSAIIKRLPKAGTRVLSEDTPLNLIIQLTQASVEFYDGSLVQYRVHASSLSNSFGMESKYSAILENESKRPDQIRRSLDILVYLREKIVYPIRIEALFDTLALDQEIRFCDLRLKWYSANPVARFFMVFVAPRGMRRWFLVRFLSLYVYSFIKAITIRFSPRNNELKG